MNHIRATSGFLSLLFLVFAPLTSAQERSVQEQGVQAQGAVLSPQAIIVNPVPDYSVEVFVDRDPSGDATPSYAVGEQITVGVRVSEDAYVYLFNVRSDSTVNQILPNNYDADGQNNFVRAGETKYFPPQGAAYAFQLDAPEGLDKVIAVASRTQLDTSTLASFAADPNFASSQLGEQGFAEALSIIVEPLPQADWVSDTALIYVGSTAPPAPLYGTISVTSEPSGAQVFIDDTFVGYTPLSYGTTVGNHFVYLEQEGYEIYELNATVVGGQTREIAATLTARQQLGPVGFESNPTGAQVYVDDQLVGTTPTGTLQLAEGAHQARFVLPGYTDTLVDFSVQGSSYQVVSGELQAQAGSLELTANIGGAVIFIDGQQVGTVPNGTGTVRFDELTSGDHEIAVVAPGYSTYVGQFTVTPGQTTPLSVSLSRR